MMEATSSFSVGYLVAFLPDPREFLPPAAAKELERLRRPDPELYRRIIESFTQDRVVLRSALQEISNAAPIGLRESADAWIVVGFCAAAQNLNSIAAAAFERAAQFGAQPASHWLARAAAILLGAGHSDAASQLIARAGGPDSGDVFVRAHSAFIDKDFGRLAEIQMPVPGMGGEDQLTLESMKASALVQLGRYAAAYDEFSRLHSEYPDRASLTVLLAQVIFLRATALDTSDRQGDLERARQLALEARDLFRQRRMDSSVAVVVACQTALAHSDGRTVFDGALPLPEGDAVPIEATNQAVLRLATQGAILMGSKRIAH